ncbi:MAG: LamG-like jellyroll fold domain-containing protein [Planctomycetia bacterium]|nr:LamG-like jellyroll fold domain-containing protein [Planctomycetia bacterium]
MHYRPLLLILVILSLRVAPQAAKADLIGLWTFNDGTLNDSSGNNYSNPTAVGDGLPAVIDGGKVGSGLKGGSYGKYNYDITSAGVKANNMTVAFWGVLPNENWRNNMGLYAGDDIQFQRNDSNSMAVYGGGSNVSASTNIASGFHHIALTTNGSEAKLYIDGALAVTNSGWTNENTVQFLTLTGTYSSGNRTNANSVTDEVQIYNAPLSADQVAYIYNNPALYAATTYKRTVSADGNWSDSAWIVNDVADQPWANSSAVELTAQNAPTLSVDANITANSIDFVSGSMTVGGTGSVTLNGEKRIGVTAAGDTATFAASLATGFTKTGAGTLSLTSTSNSLTGGITIEAGTVSANSVAALGGVGITLDGGGLNVTSAGVSTFTNAITVGEGGGSIQAGSSNYTTFASLSGTGDLTTSGNVCFTGTGGYSGKIAVTSGHYLRVTPGAVGVITELAGSGNFNMQCGSGETGTLQIGKLSAKGGSVFAFGGNGSTIELGVGTTAGDTASSACVIRGSTDNYLTLKKVGLGTQTLTRSGVLASDTYINSIKDVIVSGGKLIVESAAGSAEDTTGFFGNATVTVSAGGTLEYTNMWRTSPNAKMIIDGGTLTLNAYQYVNNLNLDNATINGSSEIRGGYKGSPTWYVTGGESTVNLLTQAVRDGSYDTFTINIADGATLNLAGGIGGLSSSSHSGMALVVNGDSASSDLVAGVLKLDGSKTVSNLGSLTFDAVTVQVSFYSDWLQGGYFSTAPVTLQNGANLINDRDHLTNGTAFTLDSATMTFANDRNTYVTDFTLKNGASMSGTSFRVGHEWDGSIRTVYEDGTTADVMNTVSANIETFMESTQRTLRFDVAENAPLTVTGSIKEHGGTAASVPVEKIGDGVLVLTNGANTMLGGLSVQAGALRLTNSGASGSGTLTIAENGTLEIGNPDAAATLSLNNSSVLLNGMLSLDVWTTGDVVSTDFIDFIGLVLGDASTLEVNLHDTTAGDPIALFTADSIAGSFADINLSPEWTSFFDGNTFYIASTASVPEPTTWLLLVLGVASLCWVRRRKR